MKRSALLLVMAVFVITLSSPLFASSPSSTSRYDTILMYIYQYLFPVTGKYFAPVGIQVIDTRGNDGDWLGGDADDYANGKELIGGDRDKKTNLTSDYFVPGAKTGSDGSVNIKAGRN